MLSQEFIQRLIDRYTPPELLELLSVEIEDIFLFDLEDYLAEHPEERDLLLEELGFPE